jgi:hypothetical protein
MCSAFFMVLLHLVMIFYTLICRRKRAGLCGLTAAKVIIFTNIDVLYGEFFANDCGKGGRGTALRLPFDSPSASLKVNAQGKRSGCALRDRDEGREISDFGMKNAD